MTRILALVIGLALAWSAGVAAAQTTPTPQTTAADELALALRTEGFVSEEPLGTRVSCSPFETLYPERDLSCFELFMRPDLVWLRVEEFVDTQEGFAWIDDAWRPADVPGGLTAAGDDDSLQRTMTDPDGREALVGVFALQRTVQVVVAVPTE